ncbi:peptidase U32 family protein [Paenibacillus barengoltzii]|jgi:putative protease|uniref:Protease n=1 Tax=Paenibacillus barengoltzii J12 TaxID=935846 RepID=A0ABY1LRY8_9BACL|nr:peptidase U32 family protein [Paenibacillus barengoltzii]MEC2343509.1 U32 family peptidase [Paenibacillus barengoltzii]SME92186.1 putative protease [Paenibacillus barengoltzii J12]SMF34922.1 putative protease [Paenibacillus barengoltzii]
MSKKPELLVPAGSLEELKRYFAAGADAALVGEARYGMRLPGDMTPQDIAEAVKVAREYGAKIYVSLNNLMTNDMLEGLPEYVKQLAECGVDAVEFGDPAVLQTVRTVAPQLKLHWNAEMTSTNYATANYWGTKGASRVVLARELNMDEITAMPSKLNIEAEVQVHGMTNIYHSKRRLVHSYMVSQGRPVDPDSNLGMSRGLFLIEAERPDEKFPIFEDVNGTHIMSSDDICILEDLHLLMAAGIDSFKIETLLKPVSYNEVIIASYRNAIEAYSRDPDGYELDESWLEAIREVQDPERELSFGFFYKEQVY